MKLRNLTTTAVLDLPDDLLWVDEHQWSTIEEVREFSLGGSLVVDRFVKLAGRPITLDSPDPSMCWVPRSTMATLLTWASAVTDDFRLEFEYPTDTRTFNVQFDLEAKPAVDAEPVKGFPQHDALDWFRINTLKLLEV